MKFKYFLRGLGVGVLFCTFIVFAAYQTSPNKLLTDEEVKARAKELGMVEAETELDKVLQGDKNKKDNETTENSETTEDGQSTEDGAVTEDNQSTENSEEDSASAAGNTTESPKSTEEGSVTKQPKTTEVNNTTEQPKKTTEDNITTEQPKEAAGDGEEVTTATITVKRGMQSSTVAKELEAKGIIKSASDFDNYLNKKGYSTKICVGTYSVKSSDSYETLAKILMKKK